MKQYSSVSWVDQLSKAIFHIQFLLGDMAKNMFFEDIYHIPAVFSGLDIYIMDWRAKNPGSSPCYVATLFCPFFVFPGSSCFTWGFLVINPFHFQVHGPHWLLLGCGKGYMGIEQGGQEAAK